MKLSLFKEQIEIRQKKLPLWQEPTEMKIRNTVKVGSLESCTTEDVVAIDLEVSRVTLYLWKKKYEGLDVSPLGRHMALQSPRGKSGSLFS